MSDDTSGTISKTKPKTDWRRLRSMTDDEIRAAIIDDPDAWPTDEAFWREARVVMPRRKETVTMRLDADLLHWFRSERGYQTRINAILRAYMNAHTDDRSSVTMTRIFRLKIREALRFGRLELRLNARLATTIAGSLRPSVKWWWL